MSNYTVIPDTFRKEYANRFLGIDYADIPRLSEDDPVIFAYYYLDKKVRVHQAFILDKIVECIKRNRMRLAMCLARQLGKSILLGIFLVWVGWYNKLPRTILKITSCYVISRDDDASVELLDKIRGLLREGDKHMNQFTGSSDFFTGSLKEPNNMHQITFLNDCFIKSIAPTGAVLGKSASVIVIDEAHRLSCENPDKFFNQFVMPTVAETGGMVILSSSPEGVIGFFYDAIDPDNKKSPDERQYESIWFSYEIWNESTLESINYQKYIEYERIRLSSEGRLKTWQQEYMALFTVTQTSFFDLKDIDDAIRDTPQKYEHKDTPCSIGIDYGMRTARTVITIRTKIKDEIIQLFQYRCSADFDINNLINPDWEHSIQQLKNRYNLFMIIPDDCVQGDMINRWIEQHAGVPVKKYNFRSDQMTKSDGVNRNCAAYSYRAKLKEGILKIPKWNIIQQFEMKIIQETEQKILISIKAPEGQLCDTFDSDMMACIPFLDMQVVTDYQFGIDDEKEIKPEDTFRRSRVDRDAFAPLSMKECLELAQGNIEDMEY